jgi:hypothetical protein
MEGDTLSWTPLKSES